MSRKPLGASERIGIIVVAVIALIVTGAGIFMARCNRAEETVTEEDVAVIAHPDSVEEAAAKSSKSKREKTDSAGYKKVRQKHTRPARRRSPLDEPIPLKL